MPSGVQSFLWGSPNLHPSCAVSARILWQCVHVQCIKEVREVNFWISFMPVLRSLLSWEQGHIVSLVPGRMNLINLRPGTLPSVWLRIYGHAKSKAGMWLSRDTPDQSAVRDTGYNYILQILPMMKWEWLGLECRREQPVQSADQKHHNS